MAPKMDPKIVQKSTSAPNTRPEASRSPPEYHFGIILDPPGGHFRAFQAPFSQIARDPPHDRTHSPKSLVKRAFGTAVGQMCWRTLARWPVWGRQPHWRSGHRAFQARERPLSEAMFGSRVKPVRKPNVYRR